MSSSDRFVFDASALLSAALDEPGGTAAAEALSRGGVISAVNVCEVVARLERAGFTDQRVTASIEAFDLLVLPLDRQAAHAVGRLEAATRAHGLSLADRACLHAGQVTGLPILTADRSWGDLPLASLGVRVELLR